MCGLRVRRIPPHSIARPNAVHRCTADKGEGCGSAWATAERTTGVGPGELNLVPIVDVDGVRVVIVAAYHPVTPEADVATLEQVMDSVQIAP